MTGADLAVLTGVGALLGLDTVSFPQAMLSRPIVGATIAGWLCGATEAGLLVGAVAECVAMETLPFGASRYPEWGSAAVVGGAIAASQQGTGPALVAALLALLLVGWVGGWTMVQVRRLNAYWAHQRHEAVARGSRRVVTGLQLFGLTADLLRGAALTLLALLVLTPVARIAVRDWAAPDSLALRAIVGVMAGVGVGAVWKIFHGVPRFRWLVVGGAAVAVLELAR